MHYSALKEVSALRKENKSLKESLQRRQIKINVLEKQLKEHKERDVSLLMVDEHLR